MKTLGHKAGFAALFWRSCNRTISLLPTSVYARPMQLTLDAGAAAFALLVAFLLRFDLHVPPNYRLQMTVWAAAMLFLRPASLFALTGYKSIWRFLALGDVLRLVGASVPPSLLLLVLRLTVGRHLGFAGIPLGVIGIEFAIFSASAIGVRALRRALYENTRRASSETKRALLLGSEGSLAAAIGQARTDSHLEVIAALVDVPHLKGLQVGGVPILGAVDELPEALSAGRFDVVLIADANLDCIAEAACITSDLDVDLRLLPSATNVMRGHVRVAAPVTMERLFPGRTMLPPPDAAVEERYWGKSLLITGGGGSIGSELARQAARLQLRRLVLLDKDENAIFEVHNRLLEADGAAEIVPIVGDVRDERLLQQVFAEHRPDVVIHSAAYKHVPLMEANPSEAILNNVMGTRKLADAAERFGCGHLLMISTDKAVNPASVMGATKRVAELLLASRNRTSATRTTCVRFGNVAGSRGSVLPIFLQQIEEGRPLTITDARMQRYFMTVAEAVQLVLQASTLDEGAAIFTLDMGDPVRITALARKVIELSGLRPERDVLIRNSGIRPGEKLEERLWAEDSRIVPTIFPRIFAVHTNAVEFDIEEAVLELERLALDRRDDEVLVALRAMPIGYRPGEPLAKAASQPSA